MNYIESKLVTAIEAILLQDYGIESQEGLVMLEIPNKSDLGDYSSNIALRLAKKVGKNPRIIAQTIATGLKQHEIVDRVEVAGPGFINFFIKPGVLAEIIHRALEQGSDFGRLPPNGRKILVEYVSVNPTGQIHVGHARGASWGDSLTRILSFSGYDVLREYYVNDLGNQIAMLSLSLFARYRQEYGFDDTLPADGYYGEDIISIAKEVVVDEGEGWLHQPREKWEPYFKELGIKYELNRIRNDLRAFRVTFDSWVSEKSLYDQGRVIKMVDDLKQLGVTYELDGALWFRSTDYGDDKDRVLIKSDGSYTYLVPDIAYHLYKVERGYGALLNLLGGDHHGYVPRLKASLEAFGHKDVLEVDIIQMVRLIEDGLEVKMSKRTGNAISLMELVEDIGVDAARYFFVSRSLQTPLDFDLNLARKQSNDNPVYYVQYAHARICSILRQAGDFQQITDFSLLDHPKEIELLKYLNEFSSVIADCAKTRLVHKIPNYVHHLASLFHSFYGELKVIDPAQQELTVQRLHLLQAIKITIANALDLIGVKAMESM